jgi:hypothetical protein
MGNTESTTFADKMKQLTSFPNPGKPTKAQQQYAIDIYSYFQRHIDACVSITQVMTALADVRKIDNVYHVIVPEGTVDVMLKYVKESSRLGKEQPTSLRLQMVRTYLGVDKAFLCKMYPIAELQQCQYYRQKCNL